MKKLIRAYFDQGVQYFSESAETMKVIALMNPAYAANAAEKLLRDAEFWSKEAHHGGDPDFPTRPLLWMTTTPLFRALNARAGEK